MTAKETPGKRRPDERLESYVETLADAHGVSGYTRTSDETLICAAYEDGTYDPWTPDDQLTNANGGITSREWLRGRESVLAYRDENGAEQFDLLDLVAGAEYLRDCGRTQVGILGGSYGDYTALMGVSVTDAFDMSASVCGVVNWETTVEDARQSLDGVLVRKLDGTPEEKPALYEERSSVSHADDIDVPLLVVQGANDPRVPASEAERLVTSLTERDIDHEYLLFEDEGHGVERTGNRIEYITRAVEFFRSHT